MNASLLDRFEEGFSIDSYALIDPTARLILLFMIPSVIMKTELLSFISRRNLEGLDTMQKHLKEVPNSELNMERVYSVISRRQSYLSPAVKSLRDILIQQVRNIFDGY